MLSTKTSTKTALRALRRSVIEKGLGRGNLTCSDGKMCVLGHIGELCQGDANAGYSHSKNSLQKRMVLTLGLPVYEVRAKKTFEQRVKEYYEARSWQEEKLRVVEAESGALEDVGTALFMLNDRVPTEYTRVQKIVDLIDERLASL